MSDFDESDQAGLVGDIFYLHLQSHVGKPDEKCEFCKGFILSGNKEYPLSSYKFIILDLSKDKDC